MKDTNRLSRKARKFLRRERGSPLVEVALVLPLLLLLLGGAVEFGNFYYQYTTLKSAVRAGARHASRWRKEDSWTVPETARMVVYGDFSSTAAGPVLPGLKESHVKVVANGATNKVESVTVSITGYNYKPVFDLGALTGVSALSLKVPVNPSVTMKQLFNGPVAH